MDFVLLIVLFSMFNDEIPASFINQFMLKIKNRSRRVRIEIAVTVPATGALLDFRDH